MTDGKDKDGGRRGFLARLRAYFLAGVLVTAPVVITGALAWWVVEFIDSQIVPLIPDRYNPDTYFREYLGVEFGLPGLGIVVLVLAITLIGAFTAGLIGRWLFGIGEKILDRMPIIRGLYKLSKQIIETVLHNHSDAFRQAVLIEYPRRGIWSIAFLTASTKGELAAKLAAEHVSVFLPTTPNPTSGFLLFVPRTDVIVLDMAVEDAVKLIISAGIVSPAAVGPQAAEAEPRTPSEAAESADVEAARESLLQALGREAEKDR